MTQVSTQSDLFLTEILFFEGTYGSWYDLNEIEPDPTNTEQQIAEFWSNHNFQAWLNELGQAYTNYLNVEINNIFKNELGITLPTTQKLITFESIIFPQYYNLSTDRLFCYIDGRLLDQCVKYALNREAQFDRYLKANFSHRPGFYSLYSNHSSDWFKKLAVDLSHVETGAYLNVFLEPFLEDIKENIYENICGNTNLLSIA